MVNNSTILLRIVSLYAYSKELFDNQRFNVSLMDEVTQQN